MYPPSCYSVLSEVSCYTAGVDFTNCLHPAMSSRKKCSPNPSIKKITPRLEHHESASCKLDCLFSDSIFQNDNAMVPLSHKVKEWFREHEKNWLPHGSLNLNRTKNMESGEEGFVQWFSMERSFFLSVSIPVLAVRFFAYSSLLARS